MNNLLYNIKRSLYSLKRQFGQPIVLSQPISNVNNVMTGEISIVYTDYSIKRAIVLPSTLVRKFVYDLSFIATNKNFTYGGYFDRFSRLVIIDKKDIQNNELELDWICTFDDIKYQIQTIEETEDNSGYLILINNIGKGTI